MSTSDLGDLVGRSGAGDRAALEQLLQEHLPALRAFVRLRMSPVLRMRESAEDLVQSACCAVLKGAENFDYRGEEAMRGWLYTAVYNKLLEHERAARAQRRDVRREVPLDGDGRTLGPVSEVYSRALSPTQALLAEERVRALEAAFDALPEHYREVLTLSRIARMSRQAIAAHLGRTEGSVRNLMTRALAELAFQLERVEAHGAG